MSGLRFRENSPTLSPSNGVGSVVEPGGSQGYARVPSDSKFVILILANVYGGDVDIHFAWIPAQALMVEEDVLILFVWIVPAQVLIEAGYLMEAGNNLSDSMEDMMNSVRELQETAEVLKKQLEDLRMKAIELKREQNRFKISIYVKMFIIIVMLVHLFIKNVMPVLF